MANMINFTIPKNEINFSNPVRVVWYVPCDIWDTMDKSSSIRSDEIKDFVKTTSMTNPSGEPEYQKIIDNVVKINCDHPNSVEDFQGFFDLTLTLENGHSLNYPLVSAYMVFPYSHPVLKD